MQDKRQVTRTRALKGVKIILNDCSHLLDCTVLNLTNLGSCVYVPSTVGIPDVFVLSFDGAWSSRRCRVMWRTESELEVAFS
jgi:hypothetical protein